MSILAEHHRMRAEEHHALLICIYNGFVGGEGANKLAAQFSAASA